MKGDVDRTHSGTKFMVLLTLAATIVNFFVLHCNWLSIELMLVEPDVYD